MTIAALLRLEAARLRVVARMVRDECSRDPAAPMAAWILDHVAGLLAGPAETHETRRETCGR